MLRVCISGIGKTGKEIARLLMEKKDIKIVSAICSPSSEKRGRDLGNIIGNTEIGVIIEGSDKLEEIIFKSRPDIVIDFSNPESAIRNCKIFSKMKVNSVIGTTGFTKIGLKKLYILTKKNKCGIVYAPNITIGINVMMILASLAANLLNNYDFQITEVHHKNKKDVPSGTAKKMAREVKKILKTVNNDNLNYDIPINSVRAGGIIGKHEVMIIGNDDKLEISHEAFSRKAFAIGALEAIRFIYDKVGYYEMNDVLNLNQVLVEYLKNSNQQIHPENFNKILRKKVL